MPGKGNPIANCTRSKLKKELIEKKSAQDGVLAIDPSIDVQGVTHFTWTVSLDNAGSSTSLDTITITKQGSDVVLSGLIGKDGKKMRDMRHTVLENGEVFQATQLGRVRKGDSIEVQGVKYSEVFLRTIPGL